MRQGWFLRPLSGLDEIFLKTVYLLFLQFGMSKATFDLLPWYSADGKGVLSWRTQACCYWNGKPHYKLK